MQEIQLEIDPAQLAGVERQLVNAVLRAATQTVHAATLLLEKDLEAVTRAAVPGRAWRAWKSEVFPRGGQAAYNPVGSVFVNGGRRSRGMMSYWSRPGVNRARDGQWLAIPTKAAGSTGRGRQLTPGEWERATGIRLQFVYKQRGYALLVADGTEAKNGSAVLRPMTARRAVQGRAKATVVIFVLIPMQRHANTVAIEPALRRARDYMVESFGPRAATLANSRGTG